MIGYNVFPKPVFTHVLGYQECIIIMSLSKLTVKWEFYLCLYLWEFRSQQIAFESLYQISKKNSMLEHF